MNWVLWRINRLRVMSPQEMLFRVRRGVGQCVERIKVAAGWAPRPATAICAKANLFGTEHGAIRPGQLRLNTAKLQDYIDGRIDFFGHELIDVGVPTAWHIEPVTHMKTPRKFGQALNYRDDSVVGNVKFIWELGRHHHLVPLAAAYALTGEIRYRRAVVEQIDGWIEANPYGIGIHWCSAIEVSLRLVSWSVVHSLLALRDGRAGLLAATSRGEDLGNAIFQQAHFVRHFLSRFSSANNHLVGELTGLLAACTVFDLGNAGCDWAEFAHRELEREAELQVFADGVGKEQAFFYHLWVLEYLLFCWLVGTRAGRTFSDAFADRILSMAKFLRDVSPEGGEPPQVGDADDGFVTRFEPSWPARPYAEVLGAVDAVFGDGSPEVSAKAFWYAAMRAPGPVSHSAPRTKRAYPAIYRDGGYAVLGSEEFHVVFDAGPLGFLGIAAHGHSDALSFCLAVDGAWWLVDPGTYAYHSQPAWRSYFRGTAAHNTIRINNENQSEEAGAFMWLRKAHAWIEEMSSSRAAQYVRAAHDGYERVGVIHRRHLRVSPMKGELEVTDAVSGACPGIAEIFFHFAPDVRVVLDAENARWVATRQGSRRRLCFSMDPVWTCAVHRGTLNPILGWYSPALDKKVPSDTLRGEAKVCSAVSLVTRIVLE
jgi:hypothetical protein